MGINELSLGFVMALAQNESAIAKFNNLSVKEKEAVIEKTHGIATKAEMRSFVDNLTRGAGL